MKPFLRRTSEPGTPLMEAPQGSLMAFKMTPTSIRRHLLAWLLPSAQPVLPAQPPTRLADGTHRASSCLCAFAQAVPSARKIPFPLIPTLPLVLVNWAFWGEAQVSGPCDLPPWVPGPRSRRPPPDWAWGVPWCHNCLLIVPSRGR